jgi:hypothetical protein
VGFRAYDQDLARGNHLRYYCQFHAVVCGALLALFQWLAKQARIGGLDQICASYALYLGEFVFI